MEIGFQTLVFKAPVNFSVYSTNMGFQTLVFIAL